jgi:hypothetical protein
MQLLGPFKIFGKVMLRLLYICRRKYHYLTSWLLLVDQSLLKISIYMWFVVFVATQFFIHVFYKFSEKTKNRKKNIENPKKCIFDIFASFLAFSTSSQKYFNALILQSLIFLVESTLILLAFKNTKK